MSKSKRSFVGALLLGAMPVLAFAASSGKITMCHRAGANNYSAISISENAQGAHRAHGDGAPGDPVPGQPHATFNDVCVPVTGVPPDCESKTGCH